MDKRKFKFDILKSEAKLRAESLSKHWSELDSEVIPRVLIAGVNRELWPLLEQALKVHGWTLGEPKEGHYYPTKL